MKRYPAQILKHHNYDILVQGTYTCRSPWLLERNRHTLQMKAGLIPGSVSDISCPMFVAPKITRAPSGLFVNTRHETENI